MTQIKEPPWLTAAVDERLALMQEKTGGIKRLAEASGGVIVMTFLTEPREHATSAEIRRWEHSCDNCQKHSVTENRGGYTERLVDDIRVVFSFGACEKCWAQ
jgi:hypothetical protein